MSVQFSSVTSPCTCLYNQLESVRQSESTLRRDVGPLATDVGLRTCTLHAHTQTRLYYNLLNRRAATDATVMCTKLHLFLFVANDLLWLRLYKKVHGKKSHSANQKSAASPHDKLYMYMYTFTLQIEGL